MKRKDLTIIIATALVAALFSFVISGALFGSPQKNPIKVPVVQKIDPTFPQVQTDTRYTSFYNKNSLNPTQLIQIGGSSNSKPFEGNSQ